MSHTAQTALTVVCYVVALVAELAGIALLAAQARATGRALRRLQADQPRRDGDGAPTPRSPLDDVVESLLGSSFDRTAAVALLAVGIVVGTVGNLLTL